MILQRFTTQHSAGMEKILYNNWSTDREIQWSTKCKAWWQMVGVERSWGSVPIHKQADICLYENVKWMY